MMESLLNLLRFDGARIPGISPWVWPICLMLYGVFVTQNGPKARMPAQPVERKSRKIHNLQNRQIVFEAAQAVESIKAFRGKFP